MTPNNQKIKKFVDRLLTLDRLGAEKIFDQALQEGSSFQLVDDLIVPALEEIGNGWEKGTVALAQVYMSSKICEKLVSRSLSLSPQKHIDQPKMAIAVLDDYHALGKTIISAALRAGGYEFQDYGRLTASELVQHVCDDSVRIMLISTLMLRSALQVKEVKRLLDAAGSSARIIVGGAPFRFDPLLWKEVGADAMGKNVAEAAKAVALCMEMEEKV